MNADGYVNVVGRKKDLVIRGGENISPVRSKNSFVDTRAFRAPRWLACRIADTAKNYVHCIVTRPGHDLSEDEVRDFCKAISRTTKCRST